MYTSLIKRMKVPNLGKETENWKLTLYPYPSNRDLCPADR